MSFLFARRRRGEDLSALARQARAWDHQAAAPATPPPARPRKRVVPDAPGVPWRVRPA